MEVYVVNVNPIIRKVLGLDHHAGMYHLLQRKKQLLSSIVQMEVEETHTFSTTVEVTSVWMEVVHIKVFKSSWDGTALWNECYLLSKWLNKKETFTIGNSGNIQLYKNRSGKLNTKWLSYMADWALPKSIAENTCLACQLETHLNQTYSSMTHH